LLRGASTAANTVSGVISNGPGTATNSVDKSEAGSWTLSGNNTYTGTTAVSAGTLLVNGNHTGAGAYNITGGKFGGEGTITTAGGANVIVSGTGTVFAPGASVGDAGTMTFALGTGTLNLAALTTANSPGLLQFDLDNPGTSDRVDFTSALGSLTLGALDLSDFTFTNLGGVSVGDVFTLFDAAAPMSAPAGPQTGTALGFNVTLNVDNSVDHVVTLSIDSVAGVNGDYNDNDVVDAADYVLWRRGGNLENDPTAGNQPGDYDYWRARFGNISNGAGTSAGTLGGQSAVPEPGTCCLLCFVGITLITTQRMGAGRRRRN
jgi:fibronectin-binding autotransporter adhesin